MTSIVKAAHRQNNLSPFKHVLKNKQLVDFFMIFVMIEKLPKISLNKIINSNIL